jgi:hypothetical protein
MYAKVAGPAMAVGRKVSARGRIVSYQVVVYESRTYPRLRISGERTRTFFLPRRSVRSPPSGRSAPP